MTNTFAIVNRNIVSSELDEGIFVVLNTELYLVNILQRLVHQRLHYVDAYWTDSASSMSGSNLANSPQVAGIV